MNDSLNKQLTRVVDDLGSVNHDKIKSLLSAINTRNLSGVDCIPWQFNIAAYQEVGGAFSLQTNDPEAYEVFNDSTIFNIPLQGCVKVSVVQDVPVSFETETSWTVEFSWPQPYGDFLPSSVVFTTLAGITDQASSDAWYVDFLAACVLAGIDISWFGTLPTFGPSYTSGSPNLITFFLFEHLEFTIIENTTDEQISISPNEVADCRYDVIEPPVYPDRRENLYVGRLTISFPDPSEADAGNLMEISIRDYVLFGKKLQSVIGSFILSPEVFRFYSPSVSFSSLSPTFYSLENVVFSRIAFLLNAISADPAYPMFVNFYGYKIGAL